VEVCVVSERKGSCFGIEKRNLKKGRAACLGPLQHLNVPTCIYMLQLLQYVTGTLLLRPFCFNRPCQTVRHLNICKFLHYHGSIFSHVVCMLLIPCSFVGRFWHFGGIDCLHLQGWRIRSKWSVRGCNFIM